MSRGHIISFIRDFRTLAEPVRQGPHSLLPLHRSRGWSSHPAAAERPQGGAAEQHWGVWAANLQARWPWSRVLHVVQLVSIHNKLLAGGILQEIFCICLVHGSSKLWCWSQTGKLPQQQRTQIVLGNMYLCWKKNKKTPLIFFPPTDTGKVQKLVNLCDVFAHVYKQDKLKQKHIQNLT